MKKLAASLLALAMCLAMCACSSTPKSEGNPVEEEIRITVQAEAAVECMFSYKDVKNVLASVTDTDDNEDGTYDVKGYITVIDDYGDRYKAKYDAVVAIDEDGDGDCKSFSMDTPTRE